MFQAYPEELTRGMEEELTTKGFQALRTVEDVDAFMKEEGTALIVVNSVCGCAAGNCRPSAVLATTHTKIPDRLGTVFAGVHREATQRAREFFTGYPPSSPSIALLKDGKIVHMIARERIEGREAEEIATELKKCFDEYC